MFVDPKELALGHSEPVVDTNTALAAKRRLGTLYKSILHAVRQEANIMKAVFAKPQEALMAFVQRLFEQRIQVSSWLNFLSNLSCVRIVLPNFFYFLRIFKDSHTRGLPVQKCSSHPCPDWLHCLSALLCWSSSIEKH